MSRLHSHSDSDDVLSGRREPAYPLLDDSKIEQRLAEIDARLAAGWKPVGRPVDEVVADLRERSLRIVKAEIDRAVENPSCPRCASRHVKDRAAPGPQGATWRFMACESCSCVWDAELDA